MQLIQNPNETHVTAGWTEFADRSHGVKWASVLFENGWNAELVMTKSRAYGDTTTEVFLTATRGTEIGTEVKKFRFTSISQASMALPIIRAYPAPDNFTDQWAEQFSEYKPEAFSQEVA